MAGCRVSLVELKWMNFVRRRLGICRIIQVRGSWGRVRSARDGKPSERPGNSPRGRRGEIVRGWRSMVDGLGRLSTGVRKVDKGWRLRNIG